MGGAGLRHVHIVGQYLFGLLRKDGRGWFTSCTRCWSISVWFIGEGCELRAGLHHVNVAGQYLFGLLGKYEGGLHHADFVGQFTSVWFVGEG